MITEQVLTHLRSREGPAWAHTIAAEIGASPRSVATACGRLVFEGLVRSEPVKGSCRLYTATATKPAPATQLPRPSPHCGAAPAGDSSA